MNHAETFAQARATCRELMALILEENAALPRHDTAIIDARLVQKKRLSLRLEQQLTELRRNRAEWQQDASYQTQITHLEEELKHFQQMATHNASLLKAAHQIRADLIMAIRDEMEKAQPKPQLYGRNGYMNQVDGQTRILAKEV